MQLPLAYLDAAALEEVPLDVWHELFGAVGWPSSLTTESLSHDTIRASFEHDEPTDGLLLALEAIHDLGTDDGREGLLEAMRDRHVVEGQIPNECGEREFALRAFLLQRHEPSVADAFVRAQIRAQATAGHKAVNEFWGTEARVVGSLQRSKARLTTLMQSHCKEHGLGDHVDIEAFDDEGACVFRIIHSDRTKTPLAIVDGGSTRSKIQYRPVHCDVVRYEAATGRLQIAARRAGLVQSYVRLAGQAIFEDPTFFVGEAACTLSPLQVKGRRALEEHDLAGVGRVWMTECTWRRGDRRVHRICSQDCFEDIESLGLPIAAEGRLIEVKLKLQIAEKGTRPATVTIRLPGKITVTPSRHEGLAHRYLEQIGVRCRVGAGLGLDFWSLHPWRHPTATWRAVLGSRVEEFASCGALVSVELESIAHPDIDGATLGIHAVNQDQYYGVATSGEVSSRSLSTTDVEGLELDLGAFGVLLGEQLELQKGQVRLVEANVLDLGPVVLGAHTIRPYYLLSTPTAGLGARLRTRAAGEHVVLLVPRGRTPGSDLATAELSDPVPSRRALERALVLSCGLQGQVPAIHYAREGARLVVDTGHGAVWVDGVRVEGIAPDTHPFKFVELLARAAGVAVSSAELSTALSPYRTDSPARHAKSDAKKAIAAALAAVGREPVEDPFPSAARGAYRCAMPADVV